MKKVLPVLAFCVASVAVVSAAGLYVTPSADLSSGFGVSNYLRGGSVGGQALYDFGFIALGVDARADYDLAYNVFNIPLMLIVGFGRDFWLGVGYTIPLGSPSLRATDGSLAAWTFGGFPNTWAMGANIVRLPLPFGALLLRSQISYIVTYPAGQEYGAFDGMFIGFKAAVGIGLEMTLYGGAHRQRGRLLR
jgi:hypothetical protein